MGPAGSIRFERHESRIRVAISCLACFPRGVRTWNSACPPSRVAWVTVKLLLRCCVLGLKNPSESALDRETATVSVAQLRGCISTAHFNNSTRQYWYIGDVATLMIRLAELRHFLNTLNATLRKWLLVDFFL